MWTKDGGMRDGMALGWVGWMDVGGDAAWARIKVPSIDRTAIWNGRRREALRGRLEGTAAAGQGRGDANKKIF